MASLASLVAWSPIISESNDGEPLVSSISDFIVDFPYDRLPGNKWLALSLRLEVVLASILFYLVSEPLLKAFTIKHGMTGKSRTFRTAVAVHNLTLAVFSFVVAVNAWHVYTTHVADRGWEAVYCDRDGAFWKSGNGTWSIIFYISKYWEFIDTWILVIKVMHVTTVLRVRWCLEWLSLIHHRARLYLGQETFFFTTISSCRDCLDNVGWSPYSSSMAIDCRHVE